MTDGSDSTIPGSCPYPEELGQAGWTILHTAAAVYPNHPTKEQQEGMRKFIEGFSWTYACSHCAYHMRMSLVRHPPVVTNKREASTYICTLHNKVNKLLYKPEYDCSPENVLRRWHPSYPEMDDTPLIEDQVAEMKRKEANAYAAQQSTPSPTPSSTSGGGGWFGWMRGGSTPEEATPPSARQSAAPQQPPKAQPNNSGAAAPSSRWSASGGLHSEGKADTADPMRSGSMRSGWSSGASKSQEAPASGASVGPGASDEDLAAIMSKVKACAVYCPDEEKKKKLASYQQ